MTKANNRLGKVALLFRDDCCFTLLLSAELVEGKGVGS